MENSSVLEQVLNLLNQARTNQDGFSVEMALYKLRDENPGKLAVTYCKDESARNALMVMVLDLYVRYFIVHQDGSNTSFYTSPKRTARFAEELNKHVAVQGPSCEFCSHLITKVNYVFTSTKIHPQTQQAIVVENASHWHCDKCGHDHMDEDQQNYLTNKINQALSSPWF